MASDALYNPANLTVMIVDDHDPIRKGIKRVLIQMGFGEVIECFDGEDALKIIAKRPVDLVILDLYMRNVTGFEVLDQVRNRDLASDIPVVIVTGEASKDEIVRCADRGADDYVLKPFQASDLEKKVVRTLNKYFSPSPLLKAIRSGDREFFKGNFQKAHDCFEVGLKVDDTSPRAAHGKALALEKLSRDDEALALLRDLLKKNHSYHKAYGAMADIYIKNGKLQEAGEALKKELEINPKQPHRQQQLARLMLKDGDALGAVEHFRVVLQADPKHAVALMGMGQAFAMADNLDKALYYFKRVRRYHPTNTKALEAGVKVAMAAGDPKKAELFLKDEKATHPDRADAYVLLIMFLMRQERDDDALSVIGELMALEPDNQQAHRMHAMISLKRGDFPKALQSLEAAAKIAPSAEIFCAMSEAFMNMNKVQDAVDAATRAVAMNPTNPQPFLVLADVHQRSQQWIKAAHLYRKASSLGADAKRCFAEANDCMRRAAMRRRSRLAS
jgi:two-component system chemotaxis response regulator CheY